MAMTVSVSCDEAEFATVMAIIAAIGVPLVLFYIYLVYRIFAGKVRVGDQGY